jgi:hypothetical protein
MGANDSPIDHRVFIVGLCRLLPKSPLPDTGFSSTAEATVNALTVTDTPQQVPPEHTRAVPIEHYLYEQAVTRRRIRLSYQDGPVPPAGPA